MKKARIIVISIGLLAIVGGALAFKAARTTFGKKFYSTLTYATFQTSYEAAESFCVPTTAAQNVTLIGSGTPVVQSYTTSLPPATSVITLTRVGGTETITVRSYNCLTALGYTTNAF
jgi:hypothetical protein